MIDWRDSVIALHPFKWLEQFGQRMRSAMGGEVTEYPVIYCDDCGKPIGNDGTEYEYPCYWDELEPQTTVLCDDCAAGVFCLYCGTFIGGTEDIFIYGAWECSFCQGWRDDHYDDEYEYDTWYDED